MKKSDIFKFDALNKYDFTNYNKQENSIIDLHSKNDCWFFIEHFLHFSKKQNPIKKKFRKNRSCSLTIKVSLNPKIQKPKRQTKFLSKLNLIEIEEKPKKLKKTIRKTKNSTSLNCIPKQKKKKIKESLLIKKNSKHIFLKKRSKSVLKKKTSKSFIKKNTLNSFVNKNLSKKFINKNLSKSFINKKKENDFKNNISKKNYTKEINSKKNLNNIQIRNKYKNRNKRKKNLNQIKIKEKIKKTQNTKSKNKKSTIFLYEPQIYNKSITKSYENFKGIKWYQLNMRDRKLANREIEQLLKENVIKC